MKRLLTVPAPRSRRRRGAWATVGEIVRAMGRRWETPPDRLALLAAAWDREIGARAVQWPLAGVRGGTVYVRARSAAAAHELALRAPALLKALNKYFSRAWIREIKAALR